MKIGFDAKRAFFNKSGLGNYSRTLISSLLQYFPENEYILYTPKIKGRIQFYDEKHLSLKGPEKLIYKLFPSLWRHMGISGQTMSEKLDIYHGLSAEIPKGINRSAGKSVVTVHDLIYMRYPHLYKAIDRNLYLRKVKYACKNADLIIAISNQTKEDIIQFTTTRPEKISVIYQDCQPEFYSRASEESMHSLRGKYNLPDKYLLFVGTIEERKNLLAIIKAMEISANKIPLVVVGKKTAYFNTVSDYIKEKNTKNIHFLDHVHNTELPALYQMASCFIYPSVFEGFGIPIIEALISGTPVITSKGSCFSEAGGPDSYYIDPGKPDELANAIDTVLNNSLFRENMIIGGLDYAKRFESKNIAREYNDLYKSIT